jgi:hypothetical protein
MGSEAPHEFTARMSIDADQFMEHLMSHERTIELTASDENDAIVAGRPVAGNSLAPVRYRIGARHDVPFDSSEIARVAGARLHHAPPQLIHGWRGEALAVRRQRRSGFDARDSGEDDPQFARCGKAPRRTQY